MKKCCFAAALAFGLCANVFGMNYVGPPTTRTAQGQWYVGISYADGEQDVELSEEGVSDVEVMDIDSRIVLGRVGVGLATDRLEIFGLGGMANMEWEGVDSDDEEAFGAGFRATMYLDKKTNLDYGIVGQFVYHKSEDSLSELSITDAQFGIGPCWRPEPFMVYGGALIHIIDGDLEIATVGEGDMRVEGETLDIEQESWLGVYLGGGVDLLECWTVTGEIQATPDAFAWAIATELRF
ncbi:MAG: hypothetical protein ACM3VT_18985 [Solirubrobacterales bacterium]